MDYIKLVKDIIEPLVNNPNDLVVTTLEDDNRLTVKVVTNNVDTARLIGKGGSVAEAIREVVQVAAKLERKTVYVKFFSNDEVEK